MVLLTRSPGFRTAGWPAAQARSPGFRTTGSPGGHWETGGRPGQDETDCYGMGRV